MATERVSILVDFNNLEPIEQEMLQRARGAMVNARNIVLRRYKVGAALLLRGGRILTSFNKERQSAQSFRCAEDGVFQLAEDEGLAETCVALAIVSQAEDPECLEPIPPCATCRGIIDEYATRSDCGGAFRILYANSSFEEEGVRVVTIGQLFPEPFMPCKKG